MFVINANAGKRNVDKVLKAVKKNGDDIKYVITDSINGLESVIDKEFSNYKVFVAVGGDGSVNSLIKHLINQSDKALAVLPVGSGNGFAKELGFKSNIKNLIKKISRGEFLDIDVLELNGNHFVNVAGIGLDAEIAHDFSKKAKRGLISYIFSTINSYFSYKAVDATIVGENLNVSGTYQMISIANTRQFGNDALISPKSQPNDGQFEIVTIKPIPWFFALPFVFKLFQGYLRNSHYINYYTCRDSVSIRTNFKKYHLDGDPLFSDGNYEVSINKKCLRVIKTKHSINK